MTIIVYKDGSWEEVSDKFIMEHEGNPNWLVSIRYEETERAKIVDTDYSAFNELQHFNPIVYAAKNLEQEMIRNLGSEATSRSLDVDWT